MVTYKVEEFEAGRYAVHGYDDDKLTWILKGPSNEGYLSESEALEDLKNYVGDANVLTDNQG